MQLARGAVDGQVRYGDVVGDRFHELYGDVFDQCARTGATWALGEVELLAPCVPRRILFVMGGFLPDGVAALPPGSVPWMLPKAVPNVSGPGGVVIPPAGVDAFWIEAEIAIVIGRPIHHATETQAREAIFGYTCFNDITAPEFMFEDVAERRWAPNLDILRAKCQDTFASMGPWISTDLTEDDLRHGLAIRGRVNGELKGEGNTRRQKFAPADWVRSASAIVSLHPGDVLTLGTPQPCDAIRGDTFEIEVEKIGTLAGRIAPQ